jgi:hypothetical protein
MAVLGHHASRMFDDDIIKQILDENIIIHKMGLARFGESSDVVYKDETRFVQKTIVKAISKYRKSLTSTVVPIPLYDPRNPSSYSIDKYRMDPVLDRERLASLSRPYPNISGLNLPVLKDRSILERNQRSYSEEIQLTWGNFLRESSKYIRNCIWEEPMSDETAPSSLLDTTPKEFKMTTPVHPRPSDLNSKMYLSQGYSSSDPPPTLKLTQVNERIPVRMSCDRVVLGSNKPMLVIAMLAHSAMLVGKFDENALNRASLYRPSIEKAFLTKYLHSKVDVFMHQYARNMLLGITSRNTMVYDCCAIEQFLNSRSIPNNKTYALLRVLEYLHKPHLIPGRPNSFARSEFPDDPTYTNTLHALQNENLYGLPVQLSTHDYTYNKSVFEPVNISYLKRHLSPYELIDAEDKRISDQINEYTNNPIRLLYHENIPEPVMIQINQHITSLSNDIYRGVTVNLSTVFVDLHNILDRNNIPGLKLHVIDFGCKGISTPAPPIRSMHDPSDPMVKIAEEWPRTHPNWKKDYVTFLDNNSELINSHIVGINNAFDAIYNELHLTIPPTFTPPPTPIIGETLFKEIKHKLVEKSGGTEPLIESKVKPKTRSNSRREVHDLLSSSGKGGGGINYTIYKKNKYRKTLKNKLHKSSKNHPK